MTAKEQYYHNKREHEQLYLIKIKKEIEKLIFSSSYEEDLIKEFGMINNMYENKKFQILKDTSVITVKILIL